MKKNISDRLIEHSILRIGEVCEIEGRKIFVLLDKNKNASDLLYNGTVLKNVSVGSFIEIKKGFSSIICKVDGEKLIDEYKQDKDKNFRYIKIDRNKRILSATVSGFIEKNRFTGGLKELPLIGNEAFILTDKKVHMIHRLLKTDNDLYVTIAKTDKEEIPINFPIDGLFNSHIAIFGNTGSGKSNTLVSLYKSLLDKLNTRLCSDNCRFFIFDFNAEFSSTECITKEKTCFNLSTSKNGGDKIPIKFEDLITIENISILFEATEKTQRPFLNRALNFYKSAKNKPDYFSFFINILVKKTKEALLMANKDNAYRILDYIEEILSYFNDDPFFNYRENIEFHNLGNNFFLKETGKENRYFSTSPEALEETILIKYICGISYEDLSNISELNQYFIFMLLQLIYDLSNYKVQVDHILPVINRFKSKRDDVNKVFKIDPEADIWKTNVVVLNLFGVNIDMRKAIPLLISKHIYKEHKMNKNEKSLSIIIDEAHNILSKTSFRETEDWKDYRLETFEEIIKEGRKFGVFVTISSQRPNDISETIISQAHNYFIHQLINQNDLRTIGNAVSYIDKVTEESIPTLPVGTCIFSGIATPMPLKLKIDELNDNLKPKSHTLKFGDITSELTF